MHDKREHPYHGMASERTRLILEWLPEARRIARQFARRLPERFQVNDLIQVGALAVISTVDRHGHDIAAIRGTIGLRIKGAIKDHLRKEDTASRGQRRLERMERAVTLKVEREQKRACTSADLCAVLGDEWMKKRAELPLDRVPMMDEAGRAMDFPDVARPCPEETAIETTIRQEIVAFARTIGSADDRAIWNHCVLGDCSQQEIAGLLGVNQSTVSRTIARLALELKNRIQREPVKN